MRILQVSRQFSPSIGGIQSSVYGLSKALAQAGHSVDVVTLRSAFTTNEKLEPQSVVDGIPVYRLNFLGSKRYSIAPQVLSFAKNYDVIHVHAIDFFIDFLSLTQLWHRKPIIVSPHGGIFHTQWLLPLKQFYFKTITRLSLKGSEVVVCDSKHDYTLFQAITETPKLRLLMGLDLEPFFSIRKNIVPNFLLGVGRVSANKGIDRLIRLLPELSRDFPDIRLTWVGDDPENLTEKLLAEAQQLGVESQVHFTGQLQDHEIHHLLSQAHLFVSTASYEGFGIAALEAMSSGTVPILTPVGIYPEIIEHGRNGFIYPFTHQTALKNFRSALSTDLSNLIEMGQAARESASQFSWNNVAPSFISIYEEVLAKQAQSPRRSPASAPY